MTSMRTHLALWMTTVVAGALLLAGLGTVILQDRSVLTNERGQLVTKAESVASSVDLINRINGFGPIAKIANVAGMTMIPFTTSGTLLLGTRVENQLASLPPGLSLTDFPAAAVSSGTTLSGRDGKTLYAAAPVTNTLLFNTCDARYTYSARIGECVRIGATGAQIRKSLLAGTLSNPPLVQAPGRACTSCAGALVVLTQPVDISSSIVSYFLLASGIALALTVAVALTISRRITGPLRKAVAITGRIASGDLDSAVEPSTRDYPEIASLSESLNAMGARLRDARDLQRNFLLSVSHDLRTPLTSIRGYAEAICDGAIDDPVAAAEVIGSEANRLERLVADLLELAKLSTHSFSLTMSPIDLVPVVTAAVNGFLPRFQPAGLTLTAHLPDGPLPVRADADRLAQVLANLIENAYKYARSSVSVVAGIREGYCVIGVEDDGPGIPPADLPHVFERLYSSRQTASRQAGTGLGLAIVAELCHAMGAHVRAESPVTQEGGTVIAITFAIAPPPPSSPGPSPASPMATLSPGFTDLAR